MWHMSHTGVNYFMRDSSRRSSDHSGILHRLPLSLQLLDRSSQSFLLVIGQFQALDDLPSTIDAAAGKLHTTPSGTP